MRFTSNEEVIKTVERHFKIRLEEHFTDFHAIRLNVWNEEDIEEELVVNLLCKDETLVSKNNLDWSLTVGYKFGDYEIELKNYNIKTSEDLDTFLAKFEKAKGLLK